MGSAKLTVTEGVAAEEATNNVGAAVAEDSEAIAVTVEGEDVDIAGIVVEKAANVAVVGVEAFAVIEEEIVVAMIPNRQASGIHRLHASLHLVCTKCRLLFRRRCIT